jgi:antitoxin component of MazEF toxin-antitoxin module
MRILSRARAVGGSLVVTIPKLVVKTQSIRAGDVVSIEVEKGKKDFFGSLRGVGSFTVEDEMKAHD